jgi:hypothetical protein
MTTSSSKSQSSENLIGSRYREGDIIRDEPLGLLYRAQDTEAPPNKQRVLLLKLKQLIHRLPQHTRDRLQEALKEANGIDISTLPKVEKWDLAQLYLVMPWFTHDTTLRQWVEAVQSPHPPLTIISLVAFIAYAVDYPFKHNYKWVRPSLDPNKIFIQQESSSLVGVSPVLADLGFAELLLDNPAYSNGAPLDAKATVQKVAILLACLLSGKLELLSSNWADKAFAETQVNEISRRSAMPRGLRSVLLLALPGAAGEQYATPGAFAEALQKLTEAPPSPPTTPPELVLSSQPGQPALSPEPKPPLRPAFPPASPVTPSVTQQTASQPIATQSVGTQPIAAAQRGAPQPKRTVSYQLKVYDRLMKMEVGTLALQDDIVTNDHLQLPRLAPQRLYFVRQEGRLGDLYTITDTGNGATTHEEFALLDGVPLSPYYAALLPVYSRLTIADYELTLLPTREAITSRPPQATPPLQVTVSDYAAQPGERLTIPVHIQNQTNEVDRLWLVLDGAPDTWQISTPAARQFFKGEEADLQLAIRLPTVAQSRANLYTLTVRLISENLAAQIAALNLAVELLPAYEYTGLITPQNLRIGSAGTFTIENYGNLSRVFRLAWRDGAKELFFDPHETTMLVRAGEAGEVIFRAYPRHWRWFGREKIHNITVLATPQGGGMAQSYTSQVTSRALIPAWTAPAILFLALGFFLLATLFLKPEFASQAISSGGVAVAATPFDLTWTPVNTCFAAIYENGLVRQPFGWRPATSLYHVTQPKADDVIEVRLRNCLFMAEKSWTVAVAAPTPTTIAAPQIITFTMTTNPVVTPTLQLLLHQTGELCLHWAVNGTYTTLKLDPPLDTWSDTSALPNAKGDLCSPIAPLFDREEPEPRKNFKLVALWGADQKVESVPVQVVVTQARCYVNTLDPIALYEGPDRQFLPRGYLSREDDRPLFVLAQPFTLFESADQLRWVQVRLADDPRESWVLFDYLYCPQDIGVLPMVGAVPPTPTPVPTETPTPTPTPTATVTPLPPPAVSVAPEIITAGGCSKLKWDIQNVKEVYLNDEGVVGVGEREVCHTEPGLLTYTWRIIQLDGNVIKLERQLRVNPGASGTPAPPPAPVQ